MKVLGTQPSVSPIEVNVDTVYVRSNIVRIETDTFIGWEYDEIQYNKDEYISLIAQDNAELQNKNLVLTEELNTLRQTNLANMLAMTDMYEAQLTAEKNNLNTMIAVTELYEVVMGGS